MWGSTLADFAKKAKEQADQLSTANVNLNEVSNNFSGAFSAFNLDAMRSEDSGEHVDQGGNRANENGAKVMEGGANEVESPGHVPVQGEGAEPSDLQQVSVVGEGQINQQTPNETKMVQGSSTIDQNYNDKDEAMLNKGEMTNDGAFAIEEASSSEGGWDNDNFDIDDEEDQENECSEPIDPPQKPESEDNLARFEGGQYEDGTVSNGVRDEEHQEDDEAAVDPVLEGDSGDDQPSAEVTPEEVPLKGPDREEKCNLSERSVDEVQDEIDNDGVEQDVATDGVQDGIGSGRMEQDVTPDDIEPVQGSIEAEAEAGEGNVIHQATEEPQDEDLASVEQVDNQVTSEGRNEDVNNESSREAENSPEVKASSEPHETQTLVEDEFPRDGALQADVPEQDPPAPTRNFAVEALLQRAAATKKEEPTVESPPSETEGATGTQEMEEGPGAQPSSDAPQFIDPDDMPDPSQPTSAPSSGNFDVGGLFSTMFSSPAKKPEAPPAQEPKPAPPMATHQNGQVDVEAMKKDHESTIERFVDQIQRLDAHHSAEMAELTAKYDARIKDLQSEMMESRAAAGDSEEVQLYKKKLRMTSDKLESLEMKVEQEKSRCSHVEQEMIRQVAEKDEALKDLEERLESSNEKVVALEKRASQAEENSSVAQEQYDTLKTRVKSVATELKERRVECRTLSLQVSELELNNKRMKDELDSVQLELAAKVSQIEEATNVGREHEDKVTNLEEKVSTVQKQMAEEKKRAEKALAAYKAKSVKALGDAQRRVASANQAKAESETELEVLRAHVEEMQTTMDEMSDRVEDRLKDSKETIASLEQALLDKETMVGDLDTELTETKDRLEELETQARRSGTEVSQIQAEWEDVQCSYQKEVDRNRELAKANTELEQQVKNLKGEMNILREEYEDLEAEVSKGSKRRVKRSLNMDNGSTNGDAGYNEASHMNGSSHHKSENDDMIAILQEELDEANSAIAGLKEALRQALTQGGKHSSKRGAFGQGVNPALNGDEIGDDASDCSSNISATGDLVMRTVASNDNSYADISLKEGDSHEEGDRPQNALFYAFEKQAELHTAKEEINRLANLVGAVQAEKQEAIEREDDLRRSLEDTEAKLNRQSKLLGTAGGRDAALSNPEEVANAATANLEYLKHVMLRYLRAKTSTEKKNLIPVISAVLCLTADEMKGVEAAINESAGLTGLGNAFFDSLESLSGKGTSGHAAPSQASSNRGQRPGLW